MSYEDNCQLGFAPPLSFRGPDPDSDCYENFRSCAGLLGCLNYGSLLGMTFDESLFTK
ncbi:hypothetical protein HanPSC8_Chr15g0682311 [Helianthus annuus]|nr:hypothetical protein HanPSC8_Chr15g0682311 [Helianthus annuus]